MYVRGEGGGGCKYAYARPRVYAYTDTHKAARIYTQGRINACAHICEGVCG